MNIRDVIRSLEQRQEGMILPLILVLLAVGMLLITPTLGHGYTSLEASTVTEGRAEELYAADSGIEAGIHWLIRGKPSQIVWTAVVEDEWVRDAYPLNAKQVTVTVSTLQTNTYLVTSQATGDGGSTTVLSRIWAVPFLEDGFEFKGEVPDGDYHVDGSGSIANNATINGNLTVDGTLEVKGAIAGDVALTGDLIIGTGGGTSITGTVICIGGDLILSNPATISADIHFQGADCTFEADNTSEQPVGRVFADGNLTFAISNTATISPDGIYVLGDVVVTLKNKKSILSGNIYAGGTVTISGAGEHVGSVFPNYEEPWPTHPDCPPWPLDPLQVLSWEIQ